MRCVVAILTLAACAAPVREGLPDPFAGARWQVVATPVPAASLRGLSVVDAQVVWASGSGGTVLRTRDGGASWQQVGPGDALDFRDVQAFDAGRALVCSAGRPARVYRTDDGGAHWRIVHEDPQPAAFFDAMAFFDRSRGLLCGDPVAGRMQLAATADGGRTWRWLLPSALPAPVDGEAAFAASGTCAAACPDGTAFVVTGGSVARLLRSVDGGATWTAMPLPLQQGRPSAGGFSVAFGDRLHAVAVGGDYERQQDGRGTACRTDDGGRTWSAAAPGPAGYRCGVTFVPGLFSCCIAVGDGGTSVSVDSGRSWRELAGEGFHAVAAAGDGAVFAVGARGRIARLVRGPSSP